MSTLFSGARWKILGFLLSRPHASPGVRELARQVGLSPAHVSRTIETFRKQGLIRRGRLDLASPRVRALKILFNVEKLESNGVVKALGELEPAGAGVYGSWANGTNGEDSDLDLWIRLDKPVSEAEIARVESKIRRAVGGETRLLVLTPERLERLKKEDAVFYNSLVFGSVTLFGEAV